MMSNKEKFMKLIMKNCKFVCFKNGEKTQIIGVNLIGEKPCIHKVALVQGLKFHFH